MNIYNQVEGYQISSRCSGSFISDNDMGFICGLLRDNKPKKILELGVARGGSTVDILRCIKELGLDCEMYSVDLFEKYFQNENLKTGYLADEFKQESGDNFGFHKMMLGKTLAERVEEIGDGIDFVFMDTFHRIPGEILDFLVLFPYLAPNAVIVLDDLKVHYYQDKRDTACTVLFQTVTAEKFLNTDSCYPNVGAFRITNDTKKYLQDVFSSLVLPWECFPEKEQLAAYDKLLNKNYTSNELKIWNHAKEMALYFNMIKNKEFNIYNGRFDQLPVDLKKYENILIYGAGNRAKYMYSLLKRLNVNVSGFVVTDNHKKDNEYCGLAVHEFSEISGNDGKTLIIQAVLSEEVQMKLVTSEYNYMILPENIWSIIMNSN